MNKSKTIIIALALIVLVYFLYTKRTRIMIPFLGSTEGEAGFKYFKYKEFDATALFPQDKGKETYVNDQGKQKLTGSGKATMKRVFVKMLDDARHIIQKEWNDNKPASEKIVLEVESGARTQHHNDSLPNSVSDSAHITGYASDLILGDYTLEQQKVALEALKRVGFSRFGMGENTVHVDADPRKNKNRVWKYSGNVININPLELN